VKDVFQQGQRKRQDGVLSELGDGTPSYAVRHYSVDEVAEILNLSPDFVRRYFENEPGVIMFGDDRPKRGKRRYRTMRIPAFVLERVHRRLSKV
jgi:hypothetical protein